MSDIFDRQRFPSFRFSQFFFLEQCEYIILSDRRSVCHSFQLKFTIYTKCVYIFIYQVIKMLCLTFEDKIYKKILTRYHSYSNIREHSNARGERALTALPSALGKLRWRHPAPSPEPSASRRRWCAGRRRGSAASWPGRPLARCKTSSVCPVLK